MAETQINNPLHGITLKMIVTQLVAHYGWEELGEYIPIRCFTHNPSLKSSLTFLRKTPWARQHVEQLYLSTLSELERDTRLPSGSDHEPA